MKVLITNFSSTSQTVLKAVMIKLGHQMEVVGDGKAALAALQRADGPRMAIIDSNLPGINGFDVCRSMKAAAEVDPELYIILMTGQNDRTEVMKALDARADDYLQKPFDVTEVSARMRIASRMLKRQREFLFSAASLRSVSTIGGNTGDTAANGGAPPHGADGKNGTATPVAAASAFTGKHKALNSLSTFTNCEELLVKAVAEMGLGDATHLKTGGAVNPELSIFSVVALPQKGIWLDMVLEMDFESAGAIFKAMTGMEEASMEDSLDIAGEIQNIFQGTIKSALQDEHLDVLTPVIPVRIPAAKRASILKSAPECRESIFSLPGAVLRVMLFPHDAPVTKKSFHDVKLRDVVVAPVNYPGDAKLTLLNKGIMMNDHHIQKLREMAEYGSVNMKLDMIAPSEISVRLAAV
jgi:CheY-like chemotaxis protein